MKTECYAMVRGSGIRLTDLDSTGRYDDLAIKYATSKAVTSIQINEITESGGHELQRNDEEEPRLHFITNETTIRYEANLNFLKCDPAILSLMTGVPMVTNANGDIVGFDAGTRLKAKSFGLEVWSKLTGVACIADAIALGFGEDNFGVDPFGSGGISASARPYGYTLFPFLKGGTVSGFTFANGLVSFNVTGSRTQRGSKWGVGPYDLEGPYMRLLTPVSRNTAWRSFITSCPPPEPFAGTFTFEDVIYGGDESGSTPDIFDANTGPWSIGKD